MFCAPRAVTFKNRENDYLEAKKYALEELLCVRWNQET